MNINKILSEALKIVFNEKKKIGSNYGEDEKFIYWMPDGYRIFKIPQKDFLIDLKKALPNKMPLNNPNKFLNDIESEVAIKTNEIKAIDKGQVIKIKGEKSHAWINIKYLKEFNSDCTFKIINQKSPLFVYENEEIVGVILPVYVRD